MNVPYWRKLLLVIVGFVVFSGLFWLLPIPGQILLVGDGWQQERTWPQVHLAPEGLRPGQEGKVTISDPVPWPHVSLFVNGREAALERYETGGPAGVWQWHYTFPVPDAGGYELVFYHHCDSGCRPWTAVAAGRASTGEPTTALLPTKLGVVFPDPQRDWHGRQGWGLELTYAQLAEEAYWGIDDLARRVAAGQANGLRILIRVDYDQGQSLPPAGDYAALDRYLTYLRRLGRDVRLQGVYGYVIGSSYNTAGGNIQAPEAMVTAEWFARLFNGYETEPDRTDNVVATLRVANPGVRILVGPLTPWQSEQDGARTYNIDAPWLNYMNTLVAAINDATETRAEAGIPQMGPDGFALQAPGRPHLSPADPAAEPALDLPRPQWGGAQAGFAVYRDWQAIINSYPYTAGLPLYISSTNTYDPDTARTPGENYPAGWLTTALSVVDREPQIAALLWFMDYFPHDDQWDFFSLSERRGRLVEAAREFDDLLQLD